MIALPVIPGGYGCIVTDFAWPYDDQAGRMRLPYEPMTLEEIRSFPLQFLAGEQTHLYSWVVDAHLEFALACIRNWGFSFKRHIVWAKTTLDGSRLRIGGGHHVRTSDELCLVACRGSIVGLVHDEPSVFFAPRTEHSQKPEELQDKAERLSPGPRLELFARRRREGWTCWGDQVDLLPSVTAESRASARAAARMSAEIDPRVWSGPAVERAFAAGAF